MVLTWNQEPSLEQGKAIAVVPESIQVHTFSVAPRFKREGNNTVPNFLNGADGQGSENNPKTVPVDTCTHTTYADRLCAAKAVLELAEEVEKSLMGRAALQSRRPKSATPKTYLSNDTRYEHLHEPYAEPYLGPGTYWVEGGRPNLGTLPADSPSRGLSPSRDPTRVSRPFVSPPRGPLFQPTEGGHLGSYLGVEFKGANDRSVEFFRTYDQRTDPADYRYAALFKEERKGLPDVDYDTQLDRSARLMPVSANAETKKGGAISFMSKEPRLANLPNKRLNDTRLGRPRWDEDQAALGPGSYAPLTSLGAAKQPTYRLFASPASTTYSGTTVLHGRRRLASVSASYGSSPWGLAGPSAGGGGSIGATASFQGTHRSQKYGPYTWKTDSSLTKTM